MNVTSKIVGSLHKIDKQKIKEGVKKLAPRTYEQKVEMGAKAIETLHCFLHPGEAATINAARIQHDLETFIVFFHNILKDRKLIINKGIKPKVQELGQAIHKSKENIINQSKSLLNVIKTKFKI